MTHNEIHMFELKYKEEIDNKDSNFEIIDVTIYPRI
jgi:hypothetical protein